MLVFKDCPGPVTLRPTDAGWNLGLSVNGFPQRSKIAVDVELVRAIGWLGWVELEALRVVPGAVGLGVGNTGAAGATTEGGVTVGG